MNIKAMKSTPPAGTCLAKSFRDVVASSACHPTTIAAKLKHGPWNRIEWSGAIDEFRA
jgi:hypothetical protein